PERNGIYNETGLMNKWPDTGPKMIWSYDQLGEGYSAAAVTSSGVFTSGMINDTGYIFALDHNGKLRWKKEYGKEWTESHTGVRSTPLVINDRLYIGLGYLTWNGGIYNPSPFVLYGDPAPWVGPDNTNN
ncbi:MAG: hypothetical protein MUC95_00725, partial [Spirochaetes bacterium]|nr:hypothetical protein [Spirochaetota bacterium]